MKTVKNLNLITTIFYTIRASLCIFAAIFTIVLICSSGDFMGETIQNIENVNKESVVAGYEILFNISGLIGGFFTAIILYLILTIILAEFLHTLIPTITNFIFRKKYKKTNEIKILKAQTYFNLIYTSISFFIVILMIIENIDMFIIGIPTIITEVISLISFIIFNNKKEEVI